MVGFSVACVFFSSALLFLALSFGMFHELSRKRPATGPYVGRVDDFIFFANVAFHDLPISHSYFFTILRRASRRVLVLSASGPKPVST